MEYLRKENEQDFDYLIRLVGIKLELKPDDLDWNDIVTLCSLNCHYDSLRKSMQPEYYGAYSIYKRLKEEAFTKLTPKTQLSEIKEKVGELAIVKKQVQTEKSELKKIQNSFVKSFSIVEELQNTMAENNYQVNVPDYCKVESDEIGDYTLILHITDFHIGYIIDDCKGNYFNWNIANKRIDKIINECYKYIEMYNIKKVYVVNTGDTIEHLSMRKNQSQFCEFGQADQINKAIEIIHRLLVALCKYCTVEYDSIYGNHDRINGDATANLDGDNADVVVREQLQKYKELSENVKLTVIDRKHTDKEIVKTICGLKCKFVHGNFGVKDDKQQLKNEMSMDDTTYDLYYKGHYHNFGITSENNGRYIINTGCLSGYNDYSVNFGCTTVASQTITIVSERNVELIKGVILQ
jgi:hypothetical protein